MGEAHQCPSLIFKEPAAGAWLNQWWWQPNLKLVASRTKCVGWVVAAIPWLGYTKVAFILTAGNWRALSAAQTRLSCVNWERRLRLWKMQISRLLWSCYLLWGWFPVPFIVFTPFSALAWRKRRLGLDDDEWESHYTSILSVLGHDFLQQEGRGSAEFISFTITFDGLWTMCSWRIQYLLPMLKDTV